MAASALSCLLLEHLRANKAASDNFRGNDNLVPFEFPYDFGRFLAGLFGILNENEAIALLGHLGGNFAAIWAFFVKLFTELELELHALERG